MTIKTPKASGDVWTDLEKLHDHFGFTEAPLTKQELWQRIQFIREELEETEEAFLEGEAHDVMDGLIDIIVVAVGTLHRADAKYRQGWKAVMNANYAKKKGFNEKRPDSNGQDLIKPRGWKPPDLGKLLGVLEKVLSEDFSPIPTQVMDAANEVLSPQREVVRIFKKCIETFEKKSQDYNSPLSKVRPADYYPRGVDSLIEMIDVHKRLRQTSLLDSMRWAEVPTVNFESVADTVLDRIVYLAIMWEWLQFMTPGQSADRDIFNRTAPEALAEIKTHAMLVNGDFDE